MGDRRFSTIRPLSGLIPTRFGAGSPADGSGSNGFHAFSGAGRSLSSSAPNINPSSAVAIAPSPNIPIVGRLQPTAAPIAGRLQPTAAPIAGRLLGPGKDITKEMPNDVLVVVMLFIGDRCSLTKSFASVSKRFNNILRCDVLHRYYCDTLQCRMRSVHVTLGCQEPGLDSRGVLLCQPSQLSMVLTRPSSTCHGFSIIADRETTCLYTVSEIAESMMTGATMHQMTINHLRFTQMCMRLLVDAIAQNGSVRSLTLRGCRLTSTDVSILASMLRVNTSLRSLTIADNSQCSFDLIRVFEDNANTTLHTLGLSSCGLGVGLAYMPVLKALQSNTTLRSLDLSGNYAENFHERWVKFFDDFFGRNTTLRHINLSRCVPDQFYHQIVASLGRNKTLCSIDMTHILNFPALCDVLARNQSLTSIRVLNKSLDGYAVMSLARMLERNTTLREINFCHDYHNRVFTPMTLKNQLSELSARFGVKIVVV